MYIRVKKILPEHRDLELKVNEQIRIVNCLARQLYSQKLAIDAAPKDYESMCYRLESMERTLAIEKMEISIAATKFIDAVEELKTVGSLQIIKRRRLESSKRVLEANLNRAKQRYSDTESEYDKLKKQVENFPEDQKAVLLPNFKLHLEQLKTELIKYSAMRNELMQKLGAELVDVKYEDIVKIEDDGSVEILKISSIPTIRIEKEYKSSEYTL